MLLRCESLEPPMSQLVRLGRGGMSALSPFYPQLRTLVGAAGTAARCHDRLLGRDVDAMRTKAGIERAVVDVLRKVGFR
jgi:hypothetical protein